MTGGWRERDLRGLSEEPIDEARIHDLWTGTAARMAARKRRRRERRIAGAAGVLVASLAAASVWLARDATPATPTFLALEDGGVPGAVEARSRAATVALADGSRLRVEAGAAWVPTDNRPSRFASRVERGTVAFDVRPGGPRRWVIRVGPTTVTVLGTRFEIARDGRSTTVRVRRGRVAVRDRRMRPERVILEAGESVTIGDPETPAAVEEPRRDGLAGVARVPRQPSRPERTVAPRPARPRWDSLATEGDHAAAYRALGDRGIRDEARRADPERLMLLADVARLSGHPADAVAPLEQLLRDAPRDPRAPLAAVLLGRIYMDSLDRPGPARRAFERALRGDLPGALRPDVERRLEALAAVPDD